MRIKRVHAEDMATALARVRDELGEDAVIISTRTLGATPEERRRGLRGVEVVAGVDERETSAVHQALSVAAITTVAPGAARAAYALEMAQAGNGQRVSDEPRRAGAASANAGTPSSAAGVAPRPPAVSEQPSAPATSGRTIDELTGRADDAVRVPVFPRVERADEDHADIAARTPFALALMSARERAKSMAAPAAQPSASTWPRMGRQSSGSTRASTATAPRPAESSFTRAADRDADDAATPPTATEAAVLAALATSLLSGDENSAHLSQGTDSRTARASTSPATPHSADTQQEGAIGIPGSPDRGSITGPATFGGAPIMSYIPPAPVSAPSPSSVTEPAANASPAASDVIGFGAGAAHAAAERAFDRLSAMGLSEEVATTALEAGITVLPVEALTDVDRIVEVALARLVSGMPAGPALERESLAGRTIVFTGPAGVGKTTVLLKTALYLRRSGMDVAIAGADVSRLGTPEQLVRYGQVLRLNAEVVYSPDDLARMLRAAPDGRVTLVDTAACPAGPAAPPEELGELLAVDPEALVVLCVAASAGQGDVRRLAALARATGADAVALTKLDEGSTSGAALNALASLRLPLLLCSSGRDVLVGPDFSSPMDLAVLALENGAASEEALVA